MDVGCFAGRFRKFAGARNSLEADIHIQYQSFDPISLLDATNPQSYTHIT